MRDLEPFSEIQSQIVFPSALHGLVLLKYYHKNPYTVDAVKAYPSKTFLVYGILSPIESCGCQEQVDITRSPGL